MLRKIYLATKHTINKVLQSGINRMHELHEYSLRLQPGKWQSFLQSFAARSAAFLTLAIDFPRYTAYQVDGDAGSIVYVGGKSTTRQIILTAFFPEGYRETLLGRVAFWNLNKATANWLQTHDLVFCCIGKNFPWKINAAYAFNSPVIVQQVLVLDQPFDDLLKTHLDREERRKARRALEQGFTLRVGRTPEDLQNFYERMYLPTVLSRHSGHEEIGDYGYMQRLFADGFLALITRDGEDVGGNLCQFANGVYYLYYLGILEGDAKLYAQKAGLALYLGMIKHACELEAREINFMDSVAISSGVYYFKQSLGAVARTDPYNQEEFVVRSNQLSPAWRETLNRVGFLEKQGMGFARVYVEDSVLNLEEAHAAAMRSGLKGIKVVSMNQSHSRASIISESGLKRSPPQLNA